jgi:hypothetical protein
MKTYVLKMYPAIVQASRIVHVTDGDLLKNPLGPHEIWMQLQDEAFVRIMQIGDIPADNVVAFKPEPGDYWVKSGNQPGRVERKAQFEILYERRDGLASETATILKSEAPHE